MVAHLGCAVICGIVRRLTVVCTAMAHRCANRSGTAEVLAAHPPLAGAAREIRTVDGPEAWQVLVRPADTAAAAPALLLQGGKWADAVQARSLVQQLQRRCAAAPG